MSVLNGGRPTLGSRVSCRSDASQDHRSVTQFRPVSPLPPSRRPAPAGAAAWSPPRPPTARRRPAGARPDRGPARRAADRTVRTAPARATAPEARAACGRGSTRVATATSDHPTGHRHGAADLLFSRSTRQVITSSSQPPGPIEVSTVRSRLHGRVSPTERSGGRSARGSRSTPLRGAGVGPYHVLVAAHRLVRGPVPRPGAGGATRERGHPSGSVAPPTSATAVISTSWPV